MKKTIIVIVLIIVACSFSKIVTPPLEEPKSIEVKPVLVEGPKQWSLTKAYYQKVKMPDGIIAELKSKKPLITIEWQALAEKSYIKPEPLPSICPFCGRPL